MFLVVHPSVIRAFSASEGTGSFYVVSYSLSFLFCYSFATEKKNPT